MSRPADIKFKWKIYTNVLRVYIIKPPITDQPLSGQQPPISQFITDQVTTQLPNIDQRTLKFSQM